jgi:aerobic-type carbon monoxide dehydrogenase small subunit (CoxS/CutS family)
MQAAALLTKNKNPSQAQIASHMAGHVCRCGCYNQIVTAVQRAAKEA